MERNWTSESIKTFESLRKLFRALTTENESWGNASSVAIACAWATTSLSLSNWLIWLRIPILSTSLTKLSNLIEWSDLYKTIDSTESNIMAQYELKKHIKGIGANPTF